MEAGASSTAKHRVAFRHQGKLLEPIAGQFLMDFSDARESHHQYARAGGPSPLRARTKPPSWFARGIALEEDPDTQPDAIAAYHQRARNPTRPRRRSHQPGHALLQPPGFQARGKTLPPGLEADPRYSLAYFDLGNVLDETGRVQEAIQTYKTALQLAPTYADAHYNLALAFEKIREPRKALKHWQSYVKLDTSGPWSVHARTQIQRILQADGLKLVYSRPK